MYSQTLDLSYCTTEEHSLKKMKFNRILKVKTELCHLQSTKGNCVLGDMKNSPWRGTYDAVVTDPPYNIRTHHLKENKEKILDPSIPHSELFCSV